MAYDIRLVNMPFSALQIPAISLAQLRSVISSACGPSCHVGIHYLNHDFGDLLGFDTYVRIAESMEGHVSGFGEWLFRQVAFPELADNEAEYFKRYANHFDGEWMEFYRTRVAPLRARLEAVLDDMIETYGLMDADMVGLTSMFFQNMPSFALARRLKAHNPNQLIVMGGANCEGTMGIEIIQHVPYIDFVFSGHALVSFPKFVERAMAGDLEACHRLDGVFSRRNCRSIDSLPADGAEIDWGRFEAARLLDGVRDMAAELPLDVPVALDYDDFLDSYDRFFTDTGRRPELLFETSRGCWWGQRAHCTFCGLNGGTMSYRAMSADRAVATIEGLFQRYAGRVSRFASVDNILPKEYVQDVFARLNVPPDVIMFYEVKADIAEKDLAILARAHVKELQPGIEALSTSTLKLMHKGTTSFNNLRFLAACVKYGIKPVWNLLVGFPGEAETTYEDYLKVIPLLSHLPPPSGVFPVRFDRFSPYFTQAQQYGLKLSPLDYYGLIYPFPARVLMNMAYYFRDENIDAPYQQGVARYLGPLRAAVKRWQARWAGADGLLAPRLDLVETEEGASIEDTRTGQFLDTLLEDREVELLSLAARPQSEGAVAEKFGEVIAFVDDKGLLFHERGQLMSLLSLGSAENVPATGATTVSGRQEAIVS
ncbi:MAG: RiPP maturation radical SAM C-methyltransferase [Alphaproteobacteria bacterium]|nr:RiPP maturation radical SAM C-methyltransferase [Alphaproteobacteria bacterium]